jgi:biotin carboxyl carrier protein
MKLRITIQGKSYDVDVQVLDQGGPAVAPPASSATAVAGSAGGLEPCVSPIAGTVTQISVGPGDSVAANQVLLVMEAMKMETNISASGAGVVKAVLVSVGDAVTQGDVLVEFE